MIRHIDLNILPVIDTRIGMIQLVNSQFVQPTGGNGVKVTAVSFL